MSSWRSFSVINPGTCWWKCDDWGSVAPWSHFLVSQVYLDGVNLPRSFVMLLSFLTGTRRWCSLPVSIARDQTFLLCITHLLHDVYSSFCTCSLVLNFDKKKLHPYSGCMCLDLFGTFCCAFGWAVCRCANGGRIASGCWASSLPPREWERESGVLLDLIGCLYMVLKKQAV